MPHSMRCDSCQTSIRLCRLNTVAVVRVRCRLDRPSDLLGDSRFPGFMLFSRQSRVDSDLQQLHDRGLFSRSHCFPFWRPDDRLGDVQDVDCHDTCQGFVSRRKLRISTATTAAPVMKKRRHNPSDVDAVYTMPANTPLMQTSQVDHMIQATRRMLIATLSLKRAVLFPRRPPSKTSGLMVRSV